MIQWTKTFVISYSMIRICLLLRRLKASAYFCDVSTQGDGRQVAFFLTPRAIHFGELCYFQRRVL
jgi:hypothetical protein